jgi:hypothetical protein
MTSVSFVSTIVRAEAGVQQMTAPAPARAAAS